MKVLTVSHLYPNFAEPLKGVFVAELTTALRPLVEIRVAAPVSWFPFVRSVKPIPYRTGSGVSSVHHPRYLALPKRLRDVRWLTYQSALDRVLGDLGKENFRPEVLHAHWLYPDGYAAAQAAQRIGAKSVVTIHGHASLGLGLGGLPTSKSGESLQLMDLIIAVSDQLRDILIHQFGVRAERIRVIHNGIDPGKFVPRDRDRARRALGLPLNVPIILCVARLAREKQLHLLVDAISRIKETQMQTFIVGVGPLRSDLQALIDQKGLQSRVILAGGVAHESLADWYYSADLFCLTSAHEGCPVVIHEALACGLPVVSTPVGAVPDLIRPGDNGLLTAPEPDAIASALAEALARPWDRHAIAAEGRTQTWEKVAKNTVDEFGRLLQC